MTSVLPPRMELSRLRRVRTEPIGWDDVFPVATARMVAFLAGITALSYTAYIIKEYVADPTEWPRGILTSFLFCTASYTVYQRARKMSPQLRDPEFQQRARRFKALKKVPWHSLQELLLADPQVELLGERTARLWTATAWGRKKTIFTARHGDLLAEFIESKRQVGSVSLHLIVSEA